MTSIDALWRELEAAGEIGGARRVDDVHPADLYAAWDVSGRPGLVLVTDHRPPAPPGLEAVLVTASQRGDERFSLGFWLRDKTLRAPFSLLCQDLVEQSSEIAPKYVAGFMLSRLARWRRLLRGERSLSQSELRGLIGELVVFRQLLAHWQPVEVTEAWLGPYDAPQDFSLESMKIEVKAIQPDARTVRISSADQLASDSPLLLALVTLVTLLPDDDGRTPASFVADITAEFKRLGAFGALTAFESKLAAGGFADAAAHASVAFRVDDVRYYTVSPGFPAIKRSELPGGVAEIRYDIELGALAPYAAMLEVQ